MSKAFTKEDSEAPEEKAVRRGIPVPTPNPVTVRGFAALHVEHTRLAATAPRTADEDARLHELADHLATAQVATPDDPGRVGATITVEDPAGRRTSYAIVGAIEADPKANAIGWQSPIARALDDAEVGDRITLPRGEVTLVAIAYDRSR